MRLNSVAFHCESKCGRATEELTGSSLKENWNRLSRIIPNAARGEGSTTGAARFDNN